MGKEKDRMNTGHFLLYFRRKWMISSLPHQRCQLSKTQTLCSFEAWKTIPTNMSKPWWHISATMKIKQNNSSRITLIPDNSVRFQQNLFGTNTHLKLQQKKNYLVLRPTNLTAVSYMFHRPSYIQKSSHSCDKSRLFYYEIILNR